MEDIWIILLDISDSMLQPVNRHVNSVSRIDAAISALLGEVSLLPDANIVIIVFNDTATLIFNGRSNERSHIRISLQQLSLGGSTDIGRALDFVKDNYQTFSSANILIITDGESTVVDAAKASRECVRQLKQVSISIVLISPTFASRKLAQSIVRNGTIKEVDSSIELVAAIKRERETFGKSRTPTTTVEHSEATRVKNIFKSIVFFILSVLLLIWMFKPTSIKHIPHGEVPINAPTIPTFDYRLVLKPTDNSLAAFYLQEELKLENDLFLLTPRVLYSTNRSSLLKEVKFFPLIPENSHYITATDESGSLALAPSTYGREYISATLVISGVVKSKGILRQGAGRVEILGLPKGAFYQAFNSDKLIIQDYLGNESVSWSITLPLNEIAFSFAKPYFRLLRPIFGPSLGGYPLVQWVVGLISIMLSFLFVSIFTPVIADKSKNWIKTYFLKLATSNSDINTKQVPLVEENSKVYPTLVALNGHDYPYIPDVIPLTRQGSMRIGTLKKNCDVIVDDQTYKICLRIEKKDELYYAFDEDSELKTYVNGIKLADREIMLESGDILEIAGFYKYQFEYLS